MEHSPAAIVAQVFLDLALVVVTARLMGRLARRLGQPAVVGEIIAGILLGPTLLGALPGDLDTLLFPLDVRPYLNVLAQLGLVLFMFIVGLEVDLSFIRGRERTAVAVSLSSVLVPFALGALLAHLLYRRHDVVAGEEVSPVAFTLFLGVAMSITAFPVLARILTERGMHRTPTGVLSLACAAVDDVLAWALLAIVVAVTVGGSPGEVAWILLQSVAFGVVMFLAVRPLLRRLAIAHQRLGRLTPDAFALVLVGVLASAWVTEQIGIHFIFGAFVFGVTMPRAGAAALNQEVLDRLEQVSVLLLLPVFFVVTGLTVDVGAIGWVGVGELGLVLLVAIAGKFLGAFSAARLQRVPPRQATALGVLMNTRGLTELVILTIGVQYGVLDAGMFTLLVVMAVLTTVITSPLLSRVYPPRVLRRDIAAAEREALGITSAYNALVVVADPSHDAGLVTLACDLLGAHSPAQVVLSRMLSRERPQPEVASGLGADLALIAAAGDELRQLAPMAAARGVGVSVTSRFTADPWTDLLAQAAATGADFLLVRRAVVPSGGVQEMTGEDSLPGTVVIVEGELPEGPEATAGPVVVVDRPGADGRAALRLAAQLSAGRRVELWIRPDTGRRAGRRVGAAAESLRRAGVAAHVEPADPEPAALVVVPATADAADYGSAVLLRVHAGTTDGDRDWTETLTAIGAGDRAEQV